MLQTCPEVRLHFVHAGSRTWEIKPRVWRGPFGLDLWVMDWCYWEGHSCSVTMDGRTGPVFRRRPGTWHIYAPGIAYRQMDDHPERSVESLWLQFQLFKPLPLLANRPFTVVHDPEEQLAPHVRAMFAVQGKEELGAMMTQYSHLLAVFAAVLDAGYHGGAGTPEDPWVVGRASAGEEAGLMMRVDRELTPRLAKPPTMEGLAAALNMSVSSLAHKYRKQAGMTVMERARSLRVEKARRLLQQGMTLKEAARQLGFCSPFHLSRMFREMTGMTASDFQKRSTHRQQ
jgi:AraC-like DNA-binding protein